MFSVRQMNSLWRGLLNFVTLLIVYMHKQNYHIKGKGKSITGHHKRLVNSPTNISILQI